MASWEESFALLVEVKNRTGSANVAAEYAQQGVKLGRWLHSQRQRHKSGKLSPERTHALESLGVDWSPQKTYDNLVRASVLEYFRRNGNIDIPYDYIDADGRRIGLWVSKQRTAMRRGTASAKDVAWVQALGLDAAPSESKFARAMRALELFREQHGHLAVPTNHVAPDGFELGTWVSDVRNKHRAGQLKPERVRQLTTIEFDLAVNRKVERWDHLFSLLSRYLDEFPGESVPRSLMVDGEPVGSWLKTQRTFHSQGRLRKERALRLEEVGISLTVAPRTNWSDEDVLTALQEAATYEFPLSGNKYDLLVVAGQVSGPRSPTIRRRYGSWEAACAAAGVEHEVVMRYSTAEVLNAVATYLAKSDRPTTKGYTEWAAGNIRPGLNVVYERFGSWDEAIQLLEQ